MSGRLSRWSTASVIFFYLPYRKTAINRSKKLRDDAFSRHLVARMARRIDDLAAQHPAVAQRDIDRAT